MTNTLRTSAIALTAAAASLLSTGCATSAPGAATSANREPPAPAITDTAVLSNSRVDISYVLGHSHRKLSAWGTGEAYTGQTQLDHQVLRESAIDRKRYAAFLGQVDQFVNSPARKPAEQTSAQSADCRSPYTVVVRMGSDARSLQGCRSSDDGQLGRLVREGEFLLSTTR